MRRPCPSGGWCPPCSNKDISRPRLWPQDLWGGFWQLDERDLPPSRPQCFQELLEGGMDGEDAKLRRASGPCSVQTGCPSPFPRSVEATSENVRASQGAEPVSDGLEPLAWQVSENSPGGTRSPSPMLPQPDPRGAALGHPDPCACCGLSVAPHGGRARRDPLRPHAVV